MKPYITIIKSNGRLIDRRQSTRYRLAGEEVLVFRHSDKKIGWIIDMSKGGLSYEYVITTESKTQHEVIDVFAFDKKRFFLPGVHCKRIYDIDESITPGTCRPVVFTRSGLRCKFSKRQTARWNDLITNAWKQN